MNSEWTGPKVTLRLTPELAEQFARAWQGELRADLESPPNLYDGSTRQDIVTPNAPERAVLLAHIDSLARQVEILDAIQWGAIDSDTEIRVPRAMVERMVTAMLDPGTTGAITRKDFATAQAAFALEDQMSMAPAAA